MALIKCHECGEAISDHARTCPKCGAPVIATIKRKQKQELSFLLVRIVFALIIGVAVWNLMKRLTPKIAPPAVQPAKP